MAGRIDQKHYGKTIRRLPELIKIYLREFYIETIFFYSLFIFVKLYYNSFIVRDVAIKC